MHYNTLDNAYIYFANLLSNNEKQHFPLRVIYLKNVREYVQNYKRIENFRINKGLLRVNIPSIYISIGM